MFSPTGLTWQAKLIVFLAVVSVSFAAGWRVHGWKIDAAQARSIPKAIKTAHTLQKKSEPIIEKKQSEIVRVEKVYVAIREKINERDDQHICFADTDAWQLYNSAITGADHHRSEPIGKAGRVDASERAEDGDDAGNETIATDKDVLNNSAINYETCRKNSIKHNALIDHIRGIKDSLCVCSD